MLAPCGLLQFSPGIGQLNWVLGCGAVRCDVDLRFLSHHGLFFCFKNY